MSDEPTERDVEALVRLLMAPGDNPFGVKFRETVKTARAILASDWYAERIVQARREGFREGVAAALRGDA